jgi:ferredoxin-NADP reductase
MEHKITIQKIEHINHNVIHLVTDKPEGYTFTPGQATEVAINSEEWRDEKRPFTFTSLPEESNLEFVIKIYPSHDGVTKQLETLEVGDTLIIGDAWGAINYKGEGSFIAGGAGITPFIAILKDLKTKNELNGNQLFFANDKERDIIYKDQLKNWLGDYFHVMLSQEDHPNFAHGYLDENFLKTHNLDTSKPVYLCGPPAMMETLEEKLSGLGLPQELLVTEAEE